MTFSEEIGGQVNTMKKHMPISTDAAFITNLVVYLSELHAQGLIPGFLDTMTAADERLKKPT